MTDLKQIDNKLYALRWRRDSLSKKDWQNCESLTNMILEIFDQYTPEEIQMYIKARRNLGYHSIFSDTYVRDILKYAN